MNVVELLRNHAESHPDMHALVEGVGRRLRHISFGDLELASGRVAALLRKTGLSPGDTVLVFHPMSIELYVAIAALLRAGLVVMFIDPSAGKRYIDSCCQLHRRRFADPLALQSLDGTAQDPHEVFHGMADPRDHPAGGGPPLHL